VPGPKDPYREPSLRVNVCLVGSLWADTSAREECCEDNGPDCVRISPIVGDIPTGRTAAEAPTVARPGGESGQRALAQDYSEEGIFSGYAP
jgi:hypothetical protein